MSLTSVAEVIRGTGVGASDIAGVMGISPFTNPWKIYARKFKLIDEEQTEEMFWGTMLEPKVAEGFSIKMDLPVEWCNKRIYSQKRVWQYCTPDAFILTTPQRQVLECKTTGLHHSAEWDPDAEDEDGVPDHYYAQVQWQLSTLELKTAYIAVLIAGQDFRVYRIEHDPVIEEILLEAGEAFWRQHILAKVEPPIDGSETARKYLRKRFPVEKETLRPATVEELDWLNEYAEVRSSLHAAETRKQELENQITQAIADHEGLKWPGGKLTWKRTRDSWETDWEALARDQLVGYSAEETKALIEQHTAVKHGYRRIHFNQQENTHAR